MSLLDFRQYVVDDDLTVQEIFEKTGFSRLKFYLTTELIHLDAPVEAEDNYPDSDNISNSRDDSLSLKNEVVRYSVYSKNEIFWERFEHVTEVNNFLHFGSY